MIDTDDIRALLRPYEVLDYFSIEYKRRGHELRTSQCAKCGQRSRDAVCVNAKHGAWHCKVCGAVGDIFDLIAGYGSTDGFPATKAIAMQIAGLTDTTADPELAQRIADKREAEAQRQAREQAERDAARAALPATFAGYTTRSLVGERYLQQRGIDPSGDLRHVVRYTPQGCPALPIRDLETSGIVGIQYRPTEPGTKPLSVFGSKLTGAALWGKLGDLDPDGTDVAIVVEGFADTLVAHLAFPGCAIFGAAGADQLETTTKVVAQRIVEVHGWLLLVPHDDATGVARATDALRAAQKTGLKLDRDLHLVDIGDEHNDLADAWRAGWRWQWPTNGDAA